MISLLTPKNRFKLLTDIIWTPSSPFYLYKTKTRPRRPADKMSAKPSELSNTLSVGLSAKPTAPSQASPTSMSARETAVVIKKSQEYAVSPLRLNTLYIVLYVKDDPPRQNTFSWKFYFHTHPTGGQKCHVRDMGNGWIADHGSTTDLFKSALLCSCIQIAAAPKSKDPLLDQAMRSHDLNLNSIPDMSDEVWAFAILRDLIRHEVVQCTDLAGLKEECLGFGNQHMAGAAADIQPRPVVRSTICL